MSFIKNRFFPIGLLILAIVLICLIAFSIHVSPAKSNVSIATSTSEVATTTSSMPNTVSTDGISYEIVTTSAAQQQGLGGRASIPDNYAMLFVFPKDGQYGFWMKDMDTSIDMIWVTDNGTIVSINGSVAPDTYPTVFYPPQPIRYVLETRSGFAKEKGWSVGTHVTLPAPYS